MCSVGSNGMRKAKRVSKVRIRGVFSHFTHLRSIDSSVLDSKSPHRFFDPTVVQMKDGYEFIKNLKNFGALSQHTLGVQLTVQGFLAFFHKLSTGEEASQEDMESLFKDFQESGKAPEELGPRLQEHLVLIALHTAEDGYYGLPLAEHPIVDSGDESDSKKPRLDKP